MFFSHTLYTKSYVVFCFKFFKNKICTKESCHISLCVQSVQETFLNIYTNILLLPFCVAERSRAYKSISPSSMTYYEEEGGKTIIFRFGVNLKGKKLLNEVKILI
jgi:hypothetical protein